MRKGFDLIAEPFFMFYNICDCVVVTTPQLSLRELSIVRLPAGC